MSKYDTKIEWRNINMPWILPTNGFFKVTEMLVNVLNICSDDELMATPGSSMEDITAVIANEEQMNALKQKEERRIALQKKILAVAKMAKYFHTLREESETGNFAKCQAFGPKSKIVAKI